MKKFKKIWRKLPIEEKTGILLRHFNINKSDIDKIRRIDDGKNRLIEAAKLQFESFGNIHTDITAWIAGYKSDRAIRAHFSSSLKLRERFVQFNNPFPNIKPTWSDVRNNIKIPESITEEVAEEVGIHIGDGCLQKSIDKRGGNGYSYRIDGDLTNELIYHEEFIKPLMKKLYNCEGYRVINKKKNSIQSNFKSKLIFHYKNTILGLPDGPKYNIKIPKSIFNFDELAKRCIVGIIDTDFTLNKSMILIGKLHSPKVMKQIDEILSRNNIKHICRIKGNVVRININKQDSIKIIEEWKLHNQKHISKYLIWKEFKKFVPFTYTEERLAVLGGRLGIEDLESISKKRKMETIKDSPHTPSG